MPGKNPTNPSFLILPMDSGPEYSEKMLKTLSPGVLALGKRRGRKLTPVLNVIFRTLSLSTSFNIIDGRLPCSSCASILVDLTSSVFLLSYWVIKLTHNPIDDIKAASTLFAYLHLNE